MRQELNTTGTTVEQEAHMYVDANDLSHRFSGTDILFEHLSFTVNQGETVAICGPSGCGKSTLLSLLAGWETPTQGSITKHGISKVGWVFQNPYGVANRTALDHVVFPLLTQGMTRKAAERAAKEAMALFDIEHAANRSFHELSGGEAQRLMLARAVCARPDMLLVDEPTAQLDMRTGHAVNQVLGNLADQGMLVVIATHDAGTRDACQRVIDLQRYVPRASAPENESNGHRSGAVS